MDSVRLVSLALGIVLFGGGCDPSIQAINPSDERVYSLYGVLDPARDTQWVRVEPIPAPTSGGAPTGLDATVTLKNLDTGQQWSLHDSLMVVQTEPQHNFWTTAPIEPATSYRLVARRSDGASARAETKTPAHPPTIVFPGRKTEGPRPVLLTNVDDLAGLKVRYFSTLGSVYNVSYYEKTLKTNAGYKSYIRRSRDVDRLGLLGVDSTKVIAAAGGPDWPAWERYHDASINDLALPDSFTNVQGGHGTVAGVYTAKKLLP